MLVRFPDYLPVRRELLRIQFAQQQWPEAQALLIQLRTKNSLSLEEQLIEAYLLLHQEQEKEARKRFKAILEKQPKNVDAIMGLAVQLLRRGFLDDSLTWLTVVWRSIQVWQEHTICAPPFYFGKVII
ncbi:MAG: hypothetical protein Ct9H300mP21_09350 [Pseudomonadota bacterium]|nr:MAG: hypothetical protein Ct9H300mP21_09350 [Pseudomonadota bacterium]